MKVESEQGAEEFLSEITLAYYLNGSGQKETLDLVPVYDRYGWIFGRKSVDEALKHTGTVAGRYTALFVVNGYMDDATKELEERLTNAATKATVEWEGTEISYRMASVVIQNEPDSARRHDLERRTQAVTESMNPLRLERLKKLHHEAQSLGFTGYTELYDRLKNLRLDWVEAQMDRLLSETAQTYFSELDYYLAGIGLTRAEATPADASFIFRAPQFDPLFPKEKLVDAFRMTVKGLGFDLNRQENLHLDIEARPLKSPRAFCAPVRMPQDVKLVIMPRGGQDDYRAMFHEGGHAEHFANVDGDLDLASRWLGDNSVTESYAFLFEYLLQNLEWWRKVMGRTDVEGYFRLSRFYKLWLLRRYAGKLKYERKLHAAKDPSKMSEEYARIMSAATGVTYSGANYLSDVDDGFYSAQYIRAWMFEMQLRACLESAYGKDWFASPRAGGFLLELWREGQATPVDQLAAQVVGPLDASPLIAELSGAV